MYKTILLHVDRGDPLAVRLRIAATLAERHGAHLTGCATTGITAGDYAMAAVTPFGSLPLVDYARMGEEAETALRHFETEARQRGVASVETMCIADHAGAALVARSPYADLIVVGQDSGAPVAAGVAVGIPDHMALHGGCPVLMVPDGCRHDHVGRSIVIGWNATLEAAHAVHAALPLLCDASLVRIVVVRPERLMSPHDPQPAHDLAAWLRRHGVYVEALGEHATGGVGDVLLHAARAGNADLIVAGAYGHSRFRELVVGGSTRTLLDNPDTCVLLAH